MSFNTWFSFFCAAWLIAISPGSGAVLSMAHGLSYGLRRASVTILGLQAGLVSVLLVAGVGVGSILAASATAFQVMKVVGALYLIYLGVSQWRSSAALMEGDAPSSGNGSHGAQLPSRRRRFLVGFFTNATNPKGILFMLAVLPQFIDQKMALLPQLAILAVTIVAVDLIVMHGYAFAAASMQGYFRDAKAVQKQNRFFGALLMAMGVALFFVKRNTAPA